MKRAVLASMLLALVACGPSSGGGDGDGTGGGDGGTGGGPDGNTNCVGASCLNYCPNGTMTTLSGVVTTPNGIDPVPGAIVYVPYGVNEFPPTVACEVCNQITESAVVATTTAPDGTFTLGPLPTVENPIPGDTIPIAVQKGRFRKYTQVPIQNWCQHNVGDNAHFKLPSKSSGHDTIPKIAVATGDYDQMECVLLKLGLEVGSFDLYKGDNAFGGGGGGTVGNFDALLMNLNKMKEYNIVFINCTSNVYEQLLTNPSIRNNILDYVASGGRLYVTDWSYDFIEQIEMFSPLIDFEPGASGAQPEPRDAAAIGTDGIEVDATVLDPGLAQWLQAVEARTGEEIIDASGRVHITHFLSGWVMQFMVPPNSDTNSKVWLEGQVSGDGVSGLRPLTTTFDYLQCGRVLYSSYHTLGKDFGGFGTTFPGYCPMGQPLSPQERVLEYLILHIADCIKVD